MRHAILDVRLLLSSFLVFISVRCSSKYSARRKEESDRLSLRFSNMALPTIKRSIYIAMTGTCSHWLVQTCTLSYFKFSVKRPTFSNVLSGKQRASCSSMSFFGGRHASAKTEGEHSSTRRLRNLSPIFPKDAPKYLKKEKNKITNDVMTKHKAKTI